ncbi:DNA gyrase subunit B [Streptomyces sp. NPDC085524]|uniref:DNA gyrase subunit B n=1 Tax=unclassified Streptomyces TaxID=2593676 RepID=UPI0035D707E6
MREETNKYDASQIKVLEGWEAVRKRPGMYIGSTTERGLHQLVYAVADRAVNEALAGRARSVEITLTPDGGVRVADDGPGVPIEDSEGADSPGLETLLTQMRFGARAGGRHDVAVGGSLSVWPSVVNALSCRMTAEVQREGVRWVQEYARGEAVNPLTEAGKAAASGTVIAFWPDADIFGASEFSFEALVGRFRELALLNRGLEISLTDQRRPGGPRSVQLRFDGGARDFVALLDADEQPAPTPADTLGFEYEDPRMAGTVEVALRWCGSHEERLLGFANSRPTTLGTHVEGLRDGVAAAVEAYAGERLLPTAIGEGMTAVVSVKLDHPEFGGCTHSELGDPVVRDCVREAVQERLGRWLEEDPERAAAVVDRMVERTRLG